MHHTKSIGDYAELKVAAEFMKKGFIVSRPLAEYAAYDLIVDTGEKMLRIQVKARSITKGAVVVQNASANRRYKENDFDIVACLCIDTDEIAVFAREDITGATNNFRIVESKNNQAIGVRFFKDYLIENF